MNPIYEMYDLMFLRYSRTPSAVPSSSSGATERRGCSSWSTARRCPGSGACTRTSPTWTMRPWAGHWGEDDGMVALIMMMVTTKGISTETKPIILDDQANAVSDWTNFQNSKKAFSSQDSWQESQGNWFGGKMSFRPWASWVLQTGGEKIGFDGSSRLSKWTNEFWISAVSGRIPPATAAPPKIWGFHLKYGALYLKYGDLYLKYGA